MQKPDRNPEITPAEPASDAGFGEAGNLQPSKPGVNKWRSPLSGSSRGIILLGWRTSANARKKASNAIGSMCRPDRNFSSTQDKKIKRIYRGLYK